MALCVNNYTGPPIYTWGGENIGYADADGLPFATLDSAVAVDGECAGPWLVKVYTAAEVDSMGGSGAGFSAADGALLAGAVLAAWATAWVFREIVNVIRTT